MVVERFSLRLPEHREKKGPSSNLPSTANAPEAMMGWTYPAKSMQREGHMGSAISASTVKRASPNRVPSALWALCVRFEAFRSIAFAGDGRRTSAKSMFRTFAILIEFHCSEIEIK
jgi:hypothetical protein